MRTRSIIGLLARSNSIERVYTLRRSIVPSRCIVMCAAYATLAFLCSGAKSQIDEHLECKPHSPFDTPPCVCSNGCAELQRSKHAAHLQDVCMVDQVR